MKSKFRLAFVGVDHPHGWLYRESLKRMPEVEVVAFYARSEDEKKTLQEPFTSRPVYTSISRLLAEEDFEGVMVMLPNNEEPQACMELAEAGKHIMAEKPVARNAQEMKPLVDLVNRAGIKFTVGYPWRFHPICQDIKKLLREGLVGRVNTLDAKMFASFVGAEDMPHRDPNHYLFNKKVSGGGFFNWLLVHWIDLLFFFLEDEVTSVTAMVDTDVNLPIDVEVGGVALLKFSKGAITSLHGGYYLPEGKESTFNIYGSEGWIRWNPQGEPEIHAFTTSSRWRIAPERKIRYSLTEEGGYGGRYGIAMLRDWIDSIREDRPPVNSINNALRGLQVVDAVYKSSQAGRQMTVRI